MKLLQSQIEKEQFQTRQLLVENETFRNQRNVPTSQPDTSFSAPSDDRKFMSSTNYHILKDEITARVLKNNFSFQHF